MALVGLIETGTVTQIVEAIGQAKSSALLLLQRDGEEGQLLFEEGEIVSSRLVPSGARDDALQRCQSWSSGLYRLIRSADDMAHPAGLHALVVNADLDSRDRWVEALHAKGFRTSLTPHHRWMRPLVASLCPDLILMTCPRQAGDCDCETLRDELDRGFAVAPLVVTVAEEAKRCETPVQLCQRAPLVPERLYHTLLEHLPGLPDADGQQAEGPGSALLAHLRRGRRPQQSAPSPRARRKRWRLFDLFSRDKGAKEPPPSGAR